MSHTKIRIAIEVTRRRLDCWNSTIQTWPAWEIRYNQQTSFGWFTLFYHICIDLRFWLVDAYHLDWSATPDSSSEFPLQKLALVSMSNKYNLLTRCVVHYCHPVFDSHNLPMYIGIVLAQNDLFGSPWEMSHSIAKAYYYFPSQMFCECMHIYFFSHLICTINLLQFLRMHVEN